FGVVEQVGVEIDVGARRRTAEEIHGAAATEHFDGHIPRFRLADGFDYDIGAAAAGELANFRDGIHAVLRGDDSVGPKPRNTFKTFSRTSNCDDARTTKLRQTHEHRANWPRANHGDRVAGFHLNVFHALHDAGERFCESGVAIIQMRWNDVGVDANNARG